MDLAVRHLRPDDRAAAVTLLARAFVDEPYVILRNGADPGVRLEALLARYGAEDPGRHTVALGAYAGGALMGALLGSLPGGCLGCDLNEDTDPWSQAVAVAHADQAPHLRVGRLGVDPSHRGVGAATGLLHAAVGLGRTFGVATLLECQAHRIGFYERRGFTVVARIADPPEADGAVLHRV